MIHNKSARRFTRILKRPMKHEDDIALSGKKGGHVVKERKQLRQIDREIRQYLDYGLE